MFHIHKWGNWYTKEVLNSFGRVVTVQFRQCGKCNLIKRNKY